MPGPTTSFGVLNRADGSVEFSHSGYTVIASVNGPMEVQRRDELPDEAVIEVNVRPAAGIGTTRERHLETIIHSTLKRVILCRRFPRTLIQVILQVTSTPEISKSEMDVSGLPLLPALLQASTMALISASIPLATTIASVSATISPTGSMTLNPSSSDVVQSSSFHVFAFTPQGRLLVSESKGTFDIGQWSDLFASAERSCCNEEDLARRGDMLMESQGSETSVYQALKDAIVEKVEQEQKWRQPT